MNIILRLITIGLLTFSSFSQSYLPSRILLSGFPPVAVDDDYATDEGIPLEVPVSGTPYSGVLSNDTDNESDSLEAVLVDDVEHGTLVLASDGSFTYTPTPVDWYGTDSFTYRAYDGTGLSIDPAVVTIVVNPVDDLPVAVEDTYVTDEDTPLDVPADGVLENDVLLDPEETITAVLDEYLGDGVLDFNDDGSFSYTPDSDFSGSDSFTYHVNDGTQDSNTVMVTLQVNPVDDPPLAVPDSYETVEDVDLVVPVLTGVLSNDSDIDGQTLTAVTDSLPSNGELVFQADGSFTYAPDENWSGTDSFTYHAVAGEVSSEIVDVVINVTTVNDPPVAVNDSYNASEDVPLVVEANGVLGNDSDAEQLPLSAVLDTQPQRGSVVMDTDGSFTFTPAGNDNGSVTFQYHASDGEEDSLPATVTIEIAPVNDNPTAVDDSYTTAEDVTLTVTPGGILANDTDIEPDSTLTPTVITGPAFGTLELAGDGSFEYEPDPDQNGTDSFTYQVTDSGGLVSNIATVEIEVTAVNDAPVAVNDGYDAVEDTQLVIAAPGVLSNDTDVDEDALTVAAIVQQPAHGTVTLNQDGSFTYNPELNHNGTVTFTYQATDEGALSNIATVTLDIEAVNDAPVAGDDSYSATEDQTLTIPARGVLINDTDVEGQTLTAQVNTGPEHGDLTLNADGGFSYEPDENWNGTDSFTYHASDGSMVSNLATVTIQVGAVNDTPVALPDSYTASEDTLLTVGALTGVLANDQDIENTLLEAEVGTGPMHGSLMLAANGSFTYMPDDDYFGQDTFTYRASDGQAESGLATVTITVQPVNDPPVPVSDAYSIAEDNPLQVAALGVISNDLDIDNELVDLSAYLVTGPLHGTVDLNQDGSFEYTPAGNYHGPDSFTYYLRDELERSTGEATVSLTVTPVNDAPVAVNDSYETNEDNPLSVTLPANGVLNNDSDIDGDTLRTHLVAGPTHGTLTLNQNGTFLYTPALNYHGSDTFTYRAGDGTLQSPLPAAVVTITIHPMNDAPVANAQSSSTAEDTSLNLTLVGTDVDGNPLTYTITTPPGHGNLGGQLPNPVYTPALNYNGQDSFVFQVSDGSLTASAIVQLTITAVNDAPVGVEDTYSLNEDNTLTSNIPGVLHNDSDVDNTNLTVSPSISPAHGTLTLNTNGSFTYIPVANYHGPDSFSYRVWDGSAQSAVTLVTLTIAPVNDSPVARGESYTGDEDRPIIINTPGLLLNDSDVDGDTLSTELFVSSNPAHGDVVVGQSGSFAYTPDENYFGSDSFSYTVSDGTITTPPVNVAINLVAVNDAPDTLEDSYSTPMDTVIEIPAPGLLGNDSDVDDQQFTAVLVGQPSRGTIEEFRPDGSFRYRTPINGQGQVTFKYAATDGKDESVETTVTIMITTTQQLGMYWISPVKDNHRYFVGAEEIPLETVVSIPEGFPCLPGYISCNPNHTYEVMTLVRYYIRISGIWYDIADVNGPPFRTLFDTSIIDKSIRGGNELGAVATVQVIEKDQAGNQVGDPVIFATPRTRIYIYRLPFDHVIRNYMPLMHK